MTEAIFDSTRALNPAQLEAVQHIEGPLLIVAGPGSGKTRVITHRIAHLNQIGVYPSQIAAVTFTNRAAREMRNRLERLMGEKSKYLKAGTFHSFSAMILRRDGEAIGIPQDFVIMDDDDQLNLIKQSMEITQIDPKRFQPRAILSTISSSKSKLLGPEALSNAASGYFEEIVSRVYTEYQKLLMQNHGLDFDDLLSRTVELLKNSDEIRDKYQQRYQYLMVDEFQDTNTAQYQISREITKSHRNLAVVGDPDQSIYSWRNADITNILSFQKDYPETKIIHLSQNYRSTGNILEAAKNVIRPNQKRIDHELFTDNPEGELIFITEAYTEEEEATGAITEVQRLIEEEGFNLRDCVITYRVNAQSRALEEACIRYGIPYKLVGGVRFYQRKEIKDLLAYLRLLQDPYDEISLERIINVPSRAIGKRTFDELISWSRNLEIPPYTALQLINDQSSTLQMPFNNRQQKQLCEFITLLNNLKDLANELELAELIDAVMDQTGYKKNLLQSDEPDAEDRLDNIREIRGLATDFNGLVSKESLPSFIENATLVSEQDSFEENEQQYLTLITLHQIKGLEYPVVFMIGMEEGLIPHARSMDDPDQIEEERRLAYVGITRAQSRLYLLRSIRRRMYGMTSPAIGSRFLRDIPLQLIQTPRMARSSKAHAIKIENVVEMPRNEEIAYPFKAGDKVSHASFGEGIVVNCSERPGDFEITVAFVGNVGIKRLLNSYAKLVKSAANDGT